MSQPNATPSEFTATIEKGQASRVFITLPFDPKEAWGTSTRYYVDLQINGHAFSTSLDARGGKYFFPFNKEMQAATGLRPGDTAQVSIFMVVEDEYQGPEIPRDLTDALNHDEKARAFFDGLSAFYQKTWIKWIDSSRQLETRQERIRETIISLSQEKKQR